MKPRRTKEDPIYMISIVSKMLGVHPQTLRIYEREGLVQPKRTNRQRLYSESDVEKLEFILQLTREMGVNRAGVDIILRMRKRMQAMQQEIEAMMDHLGEEVRKEMREKLRRALRDE
ncbi:MAG: MerR family transcriptional regulator [Thermodesulfovibrionales bacterium]